MTPRFGTSGLRGLVIELTPDLINRYVIAFISACAVGESVFVGRDLRPSSEAIARSIEKAVLQNGLTVTSCGPIPTPALAMAAMEQQSSAIMVTGSHIPADRNGLKFYTPDGEITKNDETAISAALDQAVQNRRTVTKQCSFDPTKMYLERYVDAYGPALSGLKIGIYTHSAVGRDLMLELFRTLGANVCELGRADQFVPVDTEAIDGGLRDMLRQWSVEHDLDAIVSTDGDGDRPLLTDERGEVVPGDILGQISADALHAEIVVTPISSNSGVEMSANFRKVIRTPIGSPHVIKAMSVQSGKTVGYEANGGFLLDYDAVGTAGVLKRLPTRDALLPIIATLVRASGLPLSKIVADQPQRFTASDRLQNTDPSESRQLVNKLSHDHHARTLFLTQLGSAEERLDQTDGLRIYLTDNRIVHIRPSGNAPELRLYVEGETLESAKKTLVAGMDLLRDFLAK